MMSLQERVVQKVNGLSEDNLQFLLEMIERFMWTDSTEEKTGDEGRLTPTMKAFLELEEMLVPVSEELDYDKELAEARQEKYGYTG